MDKIQENTDLSLTTKTGMCGLSAVFILLGIASIICGFVCADKFTTVYSRYWSETNYALVTLYIAGGIIIGFFNFALAVIVDACQKYRNTIKR